MIHRPVVGHACGASPAGPVVHTHASVALLRAGRSLLQLAGAWTVQAGDVFIVPEGVPHYRVDQEQSEALGVGLCMSCLPAGAWGPSLRALVVGVAAGACPVLRVDAGDQAELELTLRALHAPPEARAPWLVEARIGVLTAILMRATPVAADRPVGSPLVARALDHIARRALAPLSLIDVARAVGSAPSHLAARVKAETGEPVGAWIVHARMAQARALLLRGDDTVERVAERVGYLSPSHFHRTFRRIHGVAPAAWRSLHRRPAPAP